MDFNDEALDILGSVMPEYRTLADKQRARRKEYYYLASCKCNPEIVSVESVDSYKSRQSAEFMALLEA